MSSICLIVLLFRCISKELCPRRHVDSFRDDGNSSNLYRQKSCMYDAKTLDNASIYRLDVIFNPYLLMGSIQSDYFLKRLAKRKWFKLMNMFNAYYLINHKTLDHY